MTEIEEKLLALAADADAGRPDQVLAAVSGPTPEFPDSDSLPRELMAIWESLSLEARVVAYLWASDIALASLCRSERGDR